MANEDSIIREVEQELAEDRQWSIFRQYGPAIVGAAAAIVVGVGAWQFYNGTRERASNEQALAFTGALETLAEDAIEGRAELSGIAEAGSGGYAVLAEMRRAASLAADGNTEAAIDGFISVYQSNAAPRPMRDLARIRAGYLALADGRDAAMAHVGDLADSAGPYRFHANEIAGIGALDAQDYESALAIFNRIADDFEAPPAVSARAKEFGALALAGVTGVDLSEEIQLDDIIGAVGAAEMSIAEPTEADSAETAASDTDTAETDSVETDAAEAETPDPDAMDDGATADETAAAPTETPAPEASDESE